MIAFKELLVRAKRGEEKAFEELFEQFEPLVRKCSYMNGHTDEDLRQILLMEFVQAIRSDYKELHADHETGAADNKTG